MFNACVAFNGLGTIVATEQDTHHVVNIEFFDRSARRNFHFTDYLRCDKAFLGKHYRTFLE
jgi:chromosome transmission fidelity protein 4